MSSAPPDHSSEADYHASGPTPLSREEVEPIVAPHFEALSSVLLQAWESFATARRAAPEQLSQAGSSSRGMLVADLMREPAQRAFAGTAGVQVGERYRRPWVNFDGGNVQVRFRKMTPTLGVCPSESERAISLGYHLGDPYLPDSREATVLTAGYVLDASETAIERLALVCLLGFTQVHYFFPLPGVTGSVATQLPLTPLSAPIIRSAQAAAAQRLAQRADGS